MTQEEWRDCLADEANEARYCAGERRRQKLIEADLAVPDDFDLRVEDDDYQWVDDSDPMEDDL